MSFINLLIDKPRILFLTLSFVLLAGISSAISIPIQENPELAQRWSGVRVFYPGASPERIETQIVNELEIKLREVEEIEELDSIISQGYEVSQLSCKIAFIQILLSKHGLWFKINYHNLSHPRVLKLFLIEVAGLQ